MIRFANSTVSELEIDTPEKQILYIDATNCDDLEFALLKLMDRLAINDRITKGYTFFDYNDYALDLAKWFYANADRDIWWLLDVRKSVLEAAGYEKSHRCFDVFRHGLMLAISWGEFHDMDYRAMKLFIGGAGWKMFIGVVED